MLRIKKGQRTKIHNKLKNEIIIAEDLMSNELQDAEIDDYKHKMVVEVGVLTDLLSRFEGFSEEIVQNMEDVSDADLDKELEHAASVTTEVSKIMNRLSVYSKTINERVLSPTAVSQPGSPTSDLGTNEVQNRIEKLIELEIIRMEREGEVSQPLSKECGASVKIPPLQIDTFSGNILKWREFWDSFDAAIGKNQSFHPVQKFTYLRSKLDGEAKNVLSGMDTTNENYDIAVELLRSRFGDPQALITAHYSQLMDLPVAPNNTSKRCLTSLGEDVNHRHFISLVMSKLPKDVIVKLEEQKGQNEGWTVESLRGRLQGQLVAREAAERQHPTNRPYNDHRFIDSTVSHDHYMNPLQKHTTSEALLAGSAQRQFNPPQSCIFCGDNHWNDQCHKYNTVNSRQQRLKGRCYICLRQIHSSSSCTVVKRCFHCGIAKRHHQSLCPKKFGSAVDTVAVVSEQITHYDENDTESVGEVSSGDALLVSGDRVLLQTAISVVSNTDDSISERSQILLDSGSHRSYITERLANKLNARLIEKQVISISTFSAEKSKNIETDLVEIQLTLLDGARKLLSVNVIPKITGTIQRASINLDQYSNCLWKNLPLADSVPNKSQNVTIELLIGNDYYMELISTEKIKLQEGLYLLGSRLGWILTGRTNEKVQSNDASTMLVMGCVNQSVNELSPVSSYDQCLPVIPSSEDFWALDSIGIKDSFEITDDDKALEFFNNTIKFIDGRYYVKWAFKTDASDLPDNYQLAVGRLRSVLKRLQHDKVQLHDYDHIIQDQLRKGVIEKVDTGEEPTTVKHYIAHHPVITPKKFTTKIRIVYDASATARKGEKSLNECLLLGPLIRDNIYVDNVVTGVASEEEAVQFYTEAKSIFKQASMNLREWTSNSSKFLATLADNDRGPGFVVTVLGLRWDITEDKVIIPGPDPEIVLSATTKRQVLHALASYFDPLGFFAPILLKAKLFLQMLWKEKIEWDEQFSLEHNNLWKAIAIEMVQILHHSIPRLISANRSTDVSLHCFCDASAQAYAASVYIRVKTSTNYETSLLFAKTRLAPKGQITFPRLELLAMLIGVRCMRFVSKQLDIPITKKTIWSDSQCVLYWITSSKPMSVFVENRLNEIRRENGIHFRYVRTTDNPADLETRDKITFTMLQDTFWWEGPNWLKQEEDSWPVVNYATLEDVLRSTESETRKSKVFYQVGLVVNDSPGFQAVPPFGIDVTRFSSLQRLLRVTAWCRRYLERLRKIQFDSTELSSSEILVAKKCWDKHIQYTHLADVVEAIRCGKDNHLKSQLNLKLDEDGLIRCYGRLSNVDLPDKVKFPKLLPRHGHFVFLTVRFIHETLFYAGVSHTLSQLRHEYWIPQGRSLVRTILIKCQICRRWSGGPYRLPKMPSWLRCRVSQSSPFSYVGLDYFGPLFVKDSIHNFQKLWVCLFTCLAVRAIHLELVMGMTTDQFLLCLRRFVARRGIPTQIFSDNASQFRAGCQIMDGLWKDITHDSTVQSFLSNRNTGWKFTVEFAPWMGGFYERLVGVVKGSLRKTIGRTCLKYTHLETVLAEVEATTNSRPLVYVGDDISSGLVLTPADFLSLNPKCGFPSCSEDDPSDPSFVPRSTATEIFSSWTKGNKILKDFWEIWQNQYMLSLRERSKTHLSQGRILSGESPKVGDVVLIKDDNLSRGSWRIAGIRNLISIQDGEIRAAQLVLPDRKFIVGPLRLLYPIECPSGDATSHLSPVQLENSSTAASTPKGIPLSSIDEKMRRPMRNAAIKARTTIQGCLT